MDCKKIKLQVIAQCKSLLEDKLETLENELKLLAQDVAADTKSSAGDKFETSREMTNAEREKISGQVVLIKKQLGILSTIQTVGADKVGSGNLVETSQALIFVSISLGVIEVDATKVMVISPISPLAQALIDAEVGNQISFNGINYKIKTIC
jgi:transcription elongation GreA/GreB family factor